MNWQSTVARMREFVLKGDNRSFRSEMNRLFHSGRHCSYMQELELQQLLLAWWRELEVESGLENSVPGTQWNAFTPDTRGWGIGTRRNTIVRSGTDDNVYQWVEPGVWENLVAPSAVETSAIGAIDVGYNGYTTIGITNNTIATFDGARWSSLPAFHTGNNSIWDVAGPGPDGSIYVVAEVTQSEHGNLFSYNSGNWGLQGQNLYNNVSAGPDDLYFTFGDGTNIGVFRWNGGDFFNLAIPFWARDVGVGANGSIWACADEDAKVLYYTGEVGNWTIVPGNAYAISVGDSGLPTIITPENWVLWRS